MGLLYLDSWLRGHGAVAINNLMEDAATAEIARSQLWQWVHKPATTLDDGRGLDLDLVQAWLSEELSKIEDELGPTLYAESRLP